MDLCVIPDANAEFWIGNNYFAIHDMHVKPNVDIKLSCAWLWLQSARMFRHKTANCVRWEASLGRSCCMSHACHCARLTYVSTLDCALSASYMWTNGVLSLCKRLSWEARLNRPCLCPWSCSCNESRNLDAHNSQMLIDSRWAVIHSNDMRLSMTAYFWRKVFLKVWQLG